MDKIYTTLKKVIYYWLGYQIFFYKVLLSNLNISHRKILLINIFYTLLFIYGIYLNINIIL